MGLPEPCSLTDRHARRGTPAIEGLLLEHRPPRGAGGRAAGAVSGIAVSDAPAELVDALLRLLRLLRLLDRPADRAAPVPLVEREVLWRLLTGEQGAPIRQIGLADRALSRIGRAIRWIRDHHAAPLRVGDPAGLCAMSASSFHRHFRAVTAMTPIRFQKHIRLQQARPLRRRGGERAGPRAGRPVYCPWCGASCGRGRGGGRRHSGSGSSRRLYASPTAAARSRTPSLV